MPISEVFNIDNMIYFKTCKDKQFSLGLIDPPYGIKRDSGFGGFGEPIKRKEYEGWGDETTPDKKYFDELLRICVHVIIWGGNFLQTNYLNQVTGYFGTKSTQCRLLGTGN
jgi:site-specific DNA-methyltransferase (adenine-specific)